MLLFTFLTFMFIDREKKTEYIILMYYILLFILFKYISIKFFIFLTLKSLSSSSIGNNVEKSIKIDSSNDDFHVIR